MWYTCYVALNYTEGIDFSKQSTTTLTFQHTTTACTNFTINNDGITEGEEEFKLVLESISSSAIVNGPTTEVNVVIYDPDGKYYTKWLTFYCYIIVCFPSSVCTEIRVLQSCRLLASKGERLPLPCLALEAEYRDVGGN